jgi:hypothetical protein
MADLTIIDSEKFQAELPVDPDHLKANFSQLVDGINAVNGEIDGIGVRSVQYIGAHVGPNITVTLDLGSVSEQGLLFAFTLSSGGSPTDVFTIALNGGEAYPIYTRSRDRLKRFILYTGQVILVMRVGQEWLAVNDLDLTADKIKFPRPRNHSTTATQLVVPGPFVVPAANRGGSIYIGSETVIDTTETESLNGVEESVPAQDRATYYLYAVGQRSGGSYGYVLSRSATRTNFTLTNPASEDKELYDLVRRLPFLYDSRAASVIPQFFISEWSLSVGRVHYALAAANHATFSLPLRPSGSPTPSEYDQDDTRAIYRLQGTQTKGYVSGDDFIPPNVTKIGATIQGETDGLFTAYPPSQEASGLGERFQPPCTFSVLYPKNGDILCSQTSGTWSVQVLWYEVELNV